MTAGQHSEIASPAGLIRDVLTASIAAIQGCELHVFLDEDSEWLHQARVSTRRLRSALRTFGALLEPAWTNTLLAELKWLGDRLGAVRDADVLLGHIESLETRLPPEDRPTLNDVLEPMRDRRKLELDNLRIAFREERYQLLLAMLIDAAEYPRLVTSARTFDRKQILRLLRRPWRKLARAVERSWNDPSDAQLHQVRIRAKRFRYAAEAIAPLDADRARPILKRIVRLQDVLGEAHDLTIERQRLRLEPNSDANEAFVAGEIAGVDLLRYARARKAWRGAWRKTSRRRLRFWRSRA
ncbi:MAG: hypothetical protein NVSMB5_15870 [Candidatus Velthaea sp.]